MGYMLDMVGLYRAVAPKRAPPTAAAGRGRQESAACWTWRHRCRMSAGAGVDNGLFGYLIFHWSVPPLHAATAIVLASPPSLTWCNLNESCSTVGPAKIQFNTQAVELATRGHSSLWIFLCSCRDLQGLDPDGLWVGGLAQTRRHVVPASTSVQLSLLIGWCLIHW